LFEEQSEDGIGRRRASIDEHSTGPVDALEPRIRELLQAWRTMRPVTVIAERIE
jgi:hypothetical protein